MHRRTFLTSLSATAFLLAAAFAASAPAALAQAEIDGPTALITTFRAKPGERAKFRDIMHTVGVAQFEHWRQEGDFASYQLLFTTYAGDNVPDMFLIVKFNHSVTGECSPSRMRAQTAAERSSRAPI